MKTLTILALLIASPALAQVANQPNRLTQWVIPATGDATTAQAIASYSVLMNPAGASWCNLAITANIPPPYVNPKTARVTDPFVAGRECEIAVPTTLTQGGPIPNGDYRLITTYHSDTCIFPPSNTFQTCESPASENPIPFRVALSSQPAAPTGHRISQQE